MRSNTQLLRLLEENNVFKIAENDDSLFTLKSGLKSPIYIDFRSLISVPQIMKLAIDELWKLASCNDEIKMDYVCGVPYAALPLATGICLDNDLPMLIRRKEVKTYGTKKVIEGVYEAGRFCLIIEDVVTSGSSVLETAELLRSEGLEVHDAFVLLDRQQGAKEALAAAGITLRSVYTLADVLHYLMSEGKVTKSRVQEIHQFLNIQEVSTESSTDSQKATSNGDAKSHSLTNRLDKLKNAQAKKLGKIMMEKESNLIVAADLTTADSILQLVDEVGPCICALKLHCDIISDFTSSFKDSLVKKSKDMNFLLFEDRKLADTGTTAEQQLQGGPFRIDSWAQLVTAHSLPGRSVLRGFETSTFGTACLLIAEMSTENTLTNSGGYTKKTVKLAQQNPDLVAGFICQKRCSDDMGFLYMTPGVHLDASGDGVGQQWRSVQSAIGDDACDAVIVGRGIVAAAQQRAAVAQRYRDAAWQALLSRHTGHTDAQ